MQRRFHVEPFMLHTHIDENQFMYFHVRHSSIAKQTLLHLNPIDVTHISFLVIFLKEIIAEEY